MKMLLLNENYNGKKYSNKNNNNLIIGEWMQQSIMSKRR